MTMADLAEAVQRFLRSLHFCERAREQRERVLRQVTDDMRRLRTEMESQPLHRPAHGE